LRGPEKEPIKGRPDPTQKRTFKRKAEGGPRGVLSNPMKQSQPDGDSQSWPITDGSFLKEPKSRGKKNPQNRGKENRMRVNARE